MRAQARQTSHEEEEESVFVSMTDMTVGFLFIIMILLAFFVSQFRQSDVVLQSTYDAMVADRDFWRNTAQNQEWEILELENKLTEATTQISVLLEKIAKLEEIDPLENYLARINQARYLILQRLQRDMKRDFPNLVVEISEESDAIRFQGEGLFASGRATLSPQKRAIVERLALHLGEVLPCFTTGSSSKFSAECNPDFVIIEAVQIEGHTDNIGGPAYNRILSTDRANNTFAAMIDSTTTLMDYRNLKGQPVMSVAAYGLDRPVESNETSEGQAANRRIDLRFIMLTPRDTTEITPIREAFSRLESNAE